MDDAVAKPEPTLAEKLAFLRKPRAYGDAIRPVDARETHMSWVFLCGDDAYKLKKPVRQPYLDYSSLALRRAMCEQEVQLNRRLAAGVYRGLAALVRDGAGRLALRPSGVAPDGDVVEWLVHMQRLPDEGLLDHAIRRGGVRADAVARAANHLAAFYRDAPAVPRRTDEHLHGLQRLLDEHTAAILAVPVPQGDAGAVLARLAALLAASRASIEARVAAGRIVEGHGDLRPEHIFLGEPVAIIDCIEFSRALRLVDPLDELAFLSMECALLGAAHWGERFVAAYRQATGDAAPSALMRLYTGLRAALRLRLALGHLGDTHEPERWIAKARRYLDVVRQVLD